MFAFLFCRCCDFILWPKLRDLHKILQFICNVNSFRILNILHTVLQIIRVWRYKTSIFKHWLLLPRKYEKLPNIVIHTCEIITEKKNFVGKVGPANLALCVYMFTHYVEIVKHLDFNRYVQLTRWSGGSSPDCEARGPLFGSRDQQRFCVYFICFVVVVVNVLFFVQK